MKRIAQLILILVMFTLSACGPAPAAQGTAPTADHMAEFDAQGVAVVRGFISSASINPGKDETIFINVLAKMDGILVRVHVPIRVQRDTIIASTTTRETDVQDYMVFNPGKYAYDAFPMVALVEVSFRKSGEAFDAVSIREVERGLWYPLFEEKAKIDPLFVMDGLSQGTLIGHIGTSSPGKDGGRVLEVSIPILMQGVQTAVIMEVEAGTDTQLSSTSGAAVVLGNLTGDVQIQFTRSGKTLKATQITAIR